MITKFSFIERLLLRFNIMPHPLFDSLMHVVSGRALQVAVTMGVFEVLHRESNMTLEELARRCHMSERGAEVLLEVLNALGYVRQDRVGRISMTKRGAFLVKDIPKSMARLVQFDAEFAFPRLCDLERHLQLGWEKSNDPRGLTDKEWGYLNGAMIDLANGNAREIVERAPLSSSSKRLIDIGGLHGLHAMAYCEQYPALTAEVIDVAPDVQFAHDSVSARGLTDRIRYRQCDMLNEDLGSDFDAALAINVVHTLTKEDNERFIAAAFRALKPGGQLIIIDQIRGLGGSSKLQKLFVASLGMMLFNHAGGQTYAYASIAEWMQTIGFRDIALKKMNTPGFGIIIGVK
jgi:SAM-dependent methyltransferase